MTNIRYSPQPGIDTRRSFYLPASLYRLLPLIYVVAGVVVAVQLSGVFSLLSGALLVAAGTLVLLWRASARSERRRRERLLRRRSRSA